MHNFNCDYVLLCSQLRLDLLLLYFASCYMEALWLHLQDWRLALDEFHHILPTMLLLNVRELVYEQCNLDGVDLSWACKHMTSLTRLQLEVKSPLPEAIMTVTSLRELNISFVDSEDQSCQPSSVSARLTNLTSMVIGGTERFTLGQRLDVM